MEPIQGEDPDQSSAAWTLHFNMIDELKQKMHLDEEDTDVGNKWEKFIQALSPSASKKTPHNNDVDKLFESLLEKDEIQIGNYSLVKTTLKHLRLHDCLNLIGKYENLINRPKQEQEDSSFTAAQIPVLRLENQRCTEHNDRTITMVCRDCDYQFVCPSCIAKKHRRHEFLELKDFIEDRKQHLSTVVEKAEMKYHVIEKFLQASHKVRTEQSRQINNSKEKLKKRRNEMMKIVDDWLDEKTKDCELNQLQSNARLDEVDNELKELLQSLQTKIQKCKFTLTSSAYQEFGSLESTLMTQLGRPLPRIPQVEHADFDKEILADKDVYALAGNLSIKRLVLADDEYAVLHFCDIDVDNITTEASKTYENMTDMWKGSFDNSPALIKVYGGSPTTWEEFFSEALILRTLRHRQIIRLYGVCLSADPVSMVMEYMSNGNLTRFLKNETSVTKQQLLALSAQIADGMTFVSSEGIIHNFLAAQNILVGNVYTVKIANFSMAVRVANVKSEIEASRTGNIKYPLKWTAPECLECNATTKSDVWSFGILLWEIMSRGMIPYQEMTGREAVQKIKGGYRMSRSKDCEQPIYDKMLKCWNTSPTERPTFEFLYTFFDDYLVAAEPVYGEVNKTKSIIVDSDTRNSQNYQRKKENRKSAPNEINEQNSKGTTTKKRSKLSFWK